MATSIMSIFCPEKNKNKMLFSPFISPVLHTYQPHDLHSSPDVYLEKNRNNILAEFILFVKQNSSSPTIFDVSLASSNSNGIRERISNARKAPNLSTAMGKDKNAEENDIEFRRKALDVSSAKKDKDVKEKDIDLIELHYHFGVFRGCYCILSINEDGYLSITEGTGSERMHFFNDAKPRGEWFYDYGFVGDAVNEYKACMELLELEPSPMLIAIADPRKREIAEFLILDLEEISGGTIPINYGQFLVLNGLSKSIEGIQGTTW